MPMTTTNVAPDELPMDGPVLEHELIKLNASYRHLSQYYDAYKEETDVKVHKQNQIICDMLNERSFLEQVMGSNNATDRAVRDRKKKELMVMFDTIQQHQEVMKGELQRLHKDNKQLEELREKLLSTRMEMKGLYGPMEYRLELQRKRERLEVKHNRITVRLNYMIAENQKLRDKINDVRIDRHHFKKQYQKLTNDLVACKKTKADVLLQASQSLEQGQEAATKIRALKDQNHKEQHTFEQSMSVLGRTMIHETKLNESLAIKCNDRLEFKEQEAQEHETRVQETLVADIKTLDQQKESFDCIKEVAEFDNTDDIVRKFMAQDIENFSLFKFVTEANDVNESLAEEVNNIEKAIAETRKEQADESQNITNEFAHLEAERDHLAEELQSAQSRLTDVNGSLDAMKAMVTLTFQRIGCSRAALEAAVGLNTEISYSNLKAYILQIESRANELLNILHYVNLRNSQLTGIEPSRIDVTQFVLDSLPTFSVLLPFMEEEGAQHTGESVPLNREQLEDQAINGIAQRTREAVERSARDSDAVGKK